MQPLQLAMLEARLPIIAAGSNASPDRLLSKFGRNGDAIPVTRARLADFVVVFAGHFTAYGAMPATLYPSAGAMTDIWITWLTPGQLSAMHRTEGVIDGREAVQRYDYIVLEGLDLTLLTGRKLTKAGAYLARRMLSIDGHPIRFAEIWSKGSSLKALNQRSALRLAHRHLRPDVSFWHFMAEILSHAEARQVLFQKLTPHTVRRD